MFLVLEQKLSGFPRWGRHELLLSHTRPSSHSGVRPPAPLGDQFLSGTCAEFRRMPFLHLSASNHLHVRVECGYFIEDSASALVGRLASGSHSRSTFWNSVRNTSANPSDIWEGSPCEALRLVCREYENSHLSVWYFGFYDGFFRCSLVCLRCCSASCCCVFPGRLW